MISSCSHATEVPPETNGMLLVKLSLSREVVGATLREPYHIHHFCDPYQPRCLSLNLNFCDRAIFSLFTLCFFKSSNGA